MMHICRECASTYDECQPLWAQQRKCCPDCTHTHQPRRIQRHRTKGWRMPEGAIYVGRPTKWGNPAVVYRHINIWMAGARRNLFIPDRRYAADVFRALLTEPDVHLD